MEDILYQHTRSSTVTASVPKKPTTLLDGQIALNTAAGYESLFIKNNSGIIVTLNDWSQILNKPALASLNGSTATDFNAKNLTLNGSISGVTAGVFSSTLTAASFHLADVSFGTLYIKPGNGDSASLEICTADIHTWHGLGIIGDAGNEFGDGTRTIVFNGRSGTIEARGRIKATTGIFTNLRDGYLPYHISDTSGLADSPIRISGTNEITINARTIVGKSTTEGLRITNGTQSVNLTVDANGFLHVDKSIYSDENVSSYGIGLGGGTGGLITNVYGYTALNSVLATYNDTDLTNTFNAYTINRLASRLSTLETSTPNIAWGTPTSQYTPLTINSATKNLSVDGHVHTGVYQPLGPTTFTRYQGSYIAVRSISRLTGEYYEFWDNVAGWADLSIGGMFLHSTLSGIAATFSGNINSANFQLGTSIAAAPTTFQTTMFGSNNNGYRLRLYRHNYANDIFGEQYGAGLAVTTNDTHFFMNFSYNSAANGIYVGAGAGDGISWNAKLLVDSTHLISAANNTYNIGDTASIWKALYVGTVNTAGLNVTGDYAFRKPVQNYNTFASGNKIQDSINTNLIAGKWSKLKLTIDGVENTAACKAMADLNYEHYTEVRGLEGDAAHIINLNFVTNGLYGGNGVTYAEGKIIFNFYSQMPAGWSARVKNKDGVWTAMALTQVGATLVGAVPIVLYLTDIELTLTTGTGAPYIVGTTKWALTQIEYHANRMTVAQGAAITSVGGIINGTLALIGPGSITVADGSISCGYNPGVNYSISCSNWFRSNGASGWHNGTYLTGIYSDTANIVRTYSTNKFKVYNTEVDSIESLGGVKATSGTFSTSVTSGGSMAIGLSTLIGNGVKLNIEGQVLNAAYGLFRLCDTTALGINNGGRLTFSGYYTGTTSISSWADIGGLKENSTDRNYAGYLVFRTRPMDGANTERMRITSTGNVGIGTTNPLAALSFGATLGEKLYLYQGATGATSVGFSTASGSFNIFNDGSGTDFRFKIGGSSGTEIVTIKGGGNVGIGTASPSEILHVRAIQPIIRIEKAGILNWRIGNITGNKFGISSDSGAGEAFTIDNGNGNIGIGTTAPIFKLQVNGGTSGSVFGTTDLNSSTSTGSGIAIQTGVNTGNTYTNIYAFTAGGSAVGNLVLQTYGGNVGIGYSTGTEITNNKLAVNGNTHTKGLTVTNGTQSVNLTVDSNGFLHIDKTMYSDGNVSSYGIGYGGSATGLITNVYRYTQIGDLYNDSNVSDTFNAYTIQKIFNDKFNKTGGVISGAVTVNHNITASSFIVASVTTTNVLQAGGNTKPLSYFAAAGHLHLSSDLIATKPNSIIYSSIKYDTSVHEWTDGVVVGNFETSTEWQELSGMTAAYRHENNDYLWVLSDNPANMIAAVSKDGAVNKGVLTLTNRNAPVDYEDLESSVVDGECYLYVFDFGNNPNTSDSRGSTIDMQIMRVAEPIVTGLNQATTNFTTINCRFPSGNMPTHRDCEASIIDPNTGDIYIITKRETIPGVYKLPHLSTYVGVQTLTYMGKMWDIPDVTTAALGTALVNVVDATINKAGTEIIVKNYANMYLFTRDPLTQTIIQALQGTPTIISGYVGGGSATPAKSHPNAEPQGEGIAFDETGTHLFSCSEYLDTAGSAVGRYPLFKYSRVNAVAQVTSLQDGVSSYAGTQDTYIWDTNPAVNYGSNAAIVVDRATGVDTDRRKGLLKFDLSSIPSNARIIGAKLDLNITAEGQGWIMYKVLVPWTEDSTYTSLGGIIPDDVKASSIPDAINGFNLDTIVGHVNTNLPLDTIQAWVTGSQPNYGWMFDGLDAVGDGVQFSSCEDTTVSNRPKITIRYVIDEDTTNEYEYLESYITDFGRKLLNSRSSEMVNGLNANFLGGYKASAFALVSQSPTITSSTTTPTIAPVKIGDIHVNTYALKIYVATGKASVSDWTLVN